MNLFFASFFGGIISFFSPHVFQTTLPPSAASSAIVHATTSAVLKTKVTSTSSKIAAAPKQSFLQKIIHPQNTIIMNATTTGPLAHELVDPTGFINTNNQPITLGQFKGNKVVLLTFWTYSCINCQRTLPYINEWYTKYKDQGFEIVGVHTPEFPYEGEKTNVEAAVKKDGIQYPVVQDNNYSTWNAYGNRYWPHRYLINAKGEIIYDHIGEGDYDGTEKEIQAALAELNAK